MGHALQAFPGEDVRCREVNLLPFLTLASTKSLQTATSHFFGAPDEPSRENLCQELERFHPFNHSRDRGRQIDRNLYLSILMDRNLYLSILMAWPRHTQGTCWGGGTKQHQHQQPSPSLAINLPGCLILSYSQVIHKSQLNLSLLPRRICPPYLVKLLSTMY